MINIKNVKSLVGHQNKNQPISSQRLEGANTRRTSPDREKYIPKNDLTINPILKKKGGTE